MPSSSGSEVYHDSKVCQGYVNSGSGAQLSGIAPGSFPGLKTCDLFQSSTELAWDQAFLQSSNPKDYVIRLWGGLEVVFFETSSPRVAQAGFDGGSHDLFLHRKESSRNEGAEQPTKTLMVYPLSSPFQCRSMCHHAQLHTVPMSHG